MPELETQRLLETKFLARVEQYRTLDSTSDLAKRRAADGENRLPLLIVADEQTAGRGRGVNRWWTGRGSLACSLLLDVERFRIDRAVSPLVALGAVIRGETPHFDYVAAAASRGLAQVSLEFGLPVGFGLLTTDTLEQAIERAGSKAGNKGEEAMLSAIEMFNLFKSLS